ncbi:GNAT family N-acetyltransferase [Campylobacter upsaliensis]|nr:GNAT family N-acetyltransferase [Campylobacter upsaliensis]EIW2411568.1 N-acetyltransferase [Campylobacter upsaliensis]
MRQVFYTSKFYISKKSEKEVCFKLDFEIEISGGEEKIYKVEIRAFVDYQYLKNGNNITPNIHKNQNDWWLSYEYDRWSFHSSIAILDKYQSLGIGTFLINKMLEIALKYVPTARLSGTLSAVDEEILENHIRRDKLYKNLGFIFNEDNTGFSIEQIGDLKIRKDFDYIQEVHILNMCYQLRNLQYEKEGDVKLLESYKDDIHKLNKENAALRTRNKFILCFCIALIFLIVCLIK